MTVYLLLLGLMVACFVFLVLVVKLPASLSLIITAVVVALVAGAGFPLDKFVEGMFGYLDTCLVLITAMVFIKVIEANGMLAELTRAVISAFGRSPLILLMALTLIIMFPGMITGSCTASVLGTGALVAPILMQMGMPLAVAGAIVTSASVYGMIAPPVNISVMIMGGGIDLPYVGFDGILALMTFPLAILTSIFIGYRYIERKKLSLVVEENRKTTRAASWTVFIPLLVVIVLMVGPKAFPRWFPDLMLPLTFLIGTLLGLVTGRKFKILKVVRQGVSDILPVVGILFSVGTLIEVMTLTGMRGGIVVGALSLPASLMLLGIAVILPLFGGISVFGAASVLGVPFALALLGKNQIVVLSALSLIGAMGSYMPPVALTPVVTAGILGIPKYGTINRHCVVPAVAAVAVGILMIVFANPIAKFLGA
ncbi:MAG: TRAP transporter large permease subunit [Spirochaetes bacterium]|nr:TRAP transporter large permease subunit [Spirochaetota bacterium]